MQHNAHCYAFWNAPLHQRQAFAEIELKKLDNRMNAGGYPSADAYYADKREYWRIKAAMVQKHSYELNPVGYWFEQSN